MYIRVGYLDIQRSEFFFGIFGLFVSVKRLLSYYIFLYSTEKRSVLLYFLCTTHAGTCKKYILVPEFKIRIHKINERLAGQMNLLLKTAMYDNHFKIGNEI